MDKWLVSLDTDKVKEYVFATGRLKEMVGASALLDELNRGDTVSLISKHGGEKIFTGGGSSMASFDSQDDAEKFCHVLTSYYPEKTAAATITAVIEPYQDISFKEAVKHASIGLKREKARGQLPPNLLNNPFWVRCQRCGQYPAEYERTFPGEETAFICQVCDTKRKYIGHGESQHSPRTRLISYAADDWPREAKFAGDLGELGDLSRPRNYMGLIYADGNGIGSLIEKLINKSDEMKILAEILEESIMAALVQATKDWWCQSGETLPFIPVILGGDDIMLITTADIALPITSKLCTFFQEEVAKRTKNTDLNNGQPLQVSMSAGVAIAKASHPIFALEILASELLHSAKQLSSRIKDKGGGEVGTLDFRVVKSPSADPLEKVRKFEYQVAGNPNRMATCRPYPCVSVPGLSPQRPSWESMYEAVIKLKQSNFPHNKLHAWRELLSAESTLQTYLDLSVLHARLSKPQREALAGVFNSLEIKDMYNPFLQNPLQTEQMFSPLPDIEEIYEFINQAEAGDD